MVEIKDLLIKTKKLQKQKRDNNSIELNFILALEKIRIILVEINKKYENLVEEILKELNNNIDFILVKRAFVRFYNAIENLYKDPFSEKTNDCINYLLHEFEIENIENYLCPTLLTYKKEEFIQNLKKFDSYKNFLHVFTKHFECYLRFYYESLKNKYYFCFENLYSVCYENKKNVEQMNFDLINLCNKHCKSLEKYLKENSVN